LVLAGPAPVAVLLGADDEIFCTGLAIDDEGPIQTAPFGEILTSLFDAPKPTLAFVDGKAIGGGFGLACACDWLIATERATFGLPELLWGLIPAMIWPAIVGRLGDSVARRWTLTAHTRSAREALDAGAVDELISTDCAAQRVQRAARMLARLEPNATQRLRRWHREAQTSSLTDALRRGAALTQGMAASAIARERVAAFARGESPWS
ncbi:MAG TPA: enoyl-CoA hydratase/isomerase family protein, partial [Gemmatimonadaceae bacterium]